MLAAVTSDPLADVVSGQYERWVYPAPILDLPRWLEGNWQWFDPRHSHRMMWPDRDYWEGMDILVAGCGTNQAAVIAYTNPTARVVAVDVSEASLRHHRYLSDKYALGNLELHRLPIEDVGSLGRDFDLIMTTGVLHHLADPEVGMRALAECLRTDGVLAVMLYATYGRFGVHLLQSVFRDMGLGQDEESVALVREAIEGLGADHPVRDYIGIAPDLEDDAGVVDTFLHGRERTYTIDECRDLVSSSGLVFQDIFLKAAYYAPRATPSEFLAAVADLPREQQWSIMERLNPHNACHFFLARRAECPSSSYAIDFDSDEAVGYVPSLRFACRLEGNVIHRYNWQLTLNPAQASLMNQVDGHRTIANVVTRVLEDDSIAPADRAEVTAIALDMFQSLWQLDFLAMGMSAS